MTYMSAVSELARAEAEAWTDYDPCFSHNKGDCSKCTEKSCVHRPTEVENFEVQSAAPLARATNILLAGGDIPARLIAEVHDEGGVAALQSLANLAARHRRG